MGNISHELRATDYKLNPQPASFMMSIGEPFTKYTSAFLIKGSNIFRRVVFKSFERGGLTLKLGMQWKL